MAITGKHSLGQLLIQAWKIDEDQLQKALTIQKEKDVYIGVIFKELGYLDERELNRYISQQLKIPYLSIYVSVRILIRFYSDCYLDSYSAYKTELYFTFFSLPEDNLDIM